MNARDKALFKRRVLDRLMCFIYEPVDTYHVRELGEIIAENDQLVGVQYYGFVYRNKFHTQSRYTRPPQNIPRLHLSLMQRMDALLEEQLLIERDEKPLVRGYLARWLNSSDDAQELMMRLPDSLRRPLADALAESGISPPPVSMDAGIELFGACQKSLDALKLRLMTNVIQGDR